MSAATSPYTITGLGNGTRYYILVTARNAEAESDAVAVFRTLTGSRNPISPKLLCPDRIFRDRAVRMSPSLKRLLNRRCSKRCVTSQGIP